MDSPEALQILVESPPPNGTVVVIDDEPRLLRTLEDVVHKAGYKSCAFQNTEDFRRSRSGLNSEVFSIDWEIGTGKRRHVGPQLISWARQSSSHGACFVYTKHDVQRSAQQCGADFFVSKLTGTETANFRKAIVDGVRLSWARRIRDALKEMGQHSDVPDLAFGSWIDFKQEIAVCSISRQSALRAYLDGATHLGFLKLGLTDVLISRGWWSAFDVVAYSRMSLLEKLQQLALFAGMMLPTLAKIIAAGNVFLDTMNARKNLPDAIDSEQEHRCVVLLSLLSFFLRKGNYQPEVLRFLWHERQEGVVAQCCGDLSVAEYLATTGWDGLVKISRALRLRSKDV